ncbi:hypothetical protein AAHE18_16G136000 [Arachis hypogaea]
MSYPPKFSVPPFCSRSADGHAAFEAIASSIKDAKLEIFICGWWLCPEVYLKHPFHAHALQ